VGRCSCTGSPAPARQPRNALQHRPVALPRPDTHHKVTARFQNAISSAESACWWRQQAERRPSQAGAAWLQEQLGPEGSSGEPASDSRPTARIVQCGDYWWRIVRPRHRKCKCRAVEAMYQPQTHCVLGRRLLTRACMARDQCRRCHHTAPCTASASPALPTDAGGLPLLPQALSRHGIRSVVFDTGEHGPGGRLATRTSADRSIRRDWLGPAGGHLAGAQMRFDHAAQYFTVSDPRYGAFTRRAVGGQRGAGPAGALPGAADEMLQAEVTATRRRQHLDQTPGGGCAAGSKRWWMSGWQMAWWRPGPGGWGAWSLGAASHPSLPAAPSTWRPAACAALRSTWRARQVPGWAAAAAGQLPDACQECGRSAG